MKRRLLVVEDDHETVQKYETWLRESGLDCDIHTADCYDSALQVYRDFLGLFDAIILDLNLSGADRSRFVSKRNDPWLRRVEASVQLAEELRRVYLHVYPPKLIVVSKDVDQAILDEETKLRLKFHVELMKDVGKAARNRFVDCVTKQLELLDSETFDDREENDMLSLLPRLPYLTSDAGLLNAIQTCIDTLHVKALLSGDKAHGNLLITGPSGSGKTHLARVIHNCWHRWDRPFIKCNLAQLQQDPHRYADQLFGVVSGYGSGTIGRRGLVDRPVCGTLFLDELSNTTIENQRQIINFNATRTIAVVGEDAEQHRKATYNLIFAAQQGGGASEVMQAMVRRNCVIQVPSLESRRSDIPLVIDYVIKAVAVQRGWRIEFDNASRQQLQERDWPGQMSDLTSVIASAVLRIRHAGRNVITPNDLVFPKIAGSGSREPTEIGTVLTPAVMPAPTPPAPSQPSATPIDSIQSILAQFNEPLYTNAIRQSWREQELKVTELIETATLVHLAHTAKEAGGMPSLVNIAEELRVAKKSVERWAKSRLTPAKLKEWFPTLKPDPEENANNGVLS